MAATDKDTLKSYFLTGKYPTQDQFAELIDSMRHHLESVPVNEVAGLAELLNGKADKALADKVQELLGQLGEGIHGGSGLTEEERALLDRLAALEGGGADLLGRLEDLDAEILAEPAYAAQEGKTMVGAANALLALMKARVEALEGTFAYIDRALGTILHG